MTIINKNRNKIVALMMAVMNRNKIEGNFTIQVGVNEFIEKTDFKITCATVMMLYDSIDEKWRDHIIDIKNDDKKGDSPWIWVLDEKGVKIFNKEKTAHVL